MRLKTLIIAGFRGFPSTMEFDLDADAIVVVGANGSGKTSMFDAILWALAGSVDRLGIKQPDLVSKYSTTGEARVELTLERWDGAEVRVVRRFDGESHLTVEAVGSGVVRDSVAEATLLDVLWPDAKVAPEPWSALSRSLTRAIYLQQDAVRDFVEADGEQGRFQAVSEIVGAGRVDELQRQLESSRNAWSRATNLMDREIEPLRVQRSALFQRFERLGASVPGSATFDEGWASWLSAASKFLSKADLQVSDSDRAETLDRALRGLQARERQEQRRAEAAHELLGHLDRPVPVPPPTQELARAQASAEARLREASTRLAAAQQQAAAKRRRQVEAEDRQEALAALAGIALRFLDERCPVCNQEHDKEATRAHLQRLLADDTLTVAVAANGEVEAAAVEREAAEREAVEARDSLTAAERAAAARARWEQRVNRLAVEAGLEVSETLERDARHLHALAESSVESIRELRSSGERLNLQLARAAEMAKRADVERQLAALERQLAEREAELRWRSETGELGGQVLGALREAGAAIVAAELNRIEPLLQRIYATVDPHPSFRAVGFLTRTVRGRGRLWTSLNDRAANISVDEPSLVLSSSQLNVLAVTSFLSLNLAIETLPLQLVALDDPLQSLDTVNLLGLADLLRRVKASRQVMVSTHDERLAGLLERKLRPITEGQRTRVVRLENWTPTGPALEQSDVPRDERPLRLVASA